MTDLPTDLWVASLLRRVNAAGGFAAVAAKGRGPRAPVLLLLRDRGAVAAWERVPDLTHGHRWVRAADGEAAAAAVAEKQRRFDPDLWVLELDIADAARFIGISTRET